MKRKKKIDRNLILFAFITKALARVIKFIVIIKPKFKFKRLLQWKSLKKIPSNNAG